jgi:predicted ester cyclase
VPDPTAPTRDGAKSATRRLAARATPCETSAVSSSSTGSSAGAAAPSLLEENKALVRYIIEEALNKGNLSIADECFAPDYLVHLPSQPNLPRGPDVFKQLIGMWRSAFADWHMTIEELVAERDLVANRFTTTGTHTGALQGIEATGKPMVVRGMELHRVSNGKVTESWVCNDLPGILVELGALPGFGW